jgi:hypothetical protein
MTYDYSNQAQAQYKRNELRRLGYAVSHPWFSDHQWHITVNIIRNY